MIRPFPFLVAAMCLGSVALHAADQLLVKAESFKDPGGWSLDTQFIEIMGSPCLLAHGLGQPVKDATTTVTFPSVGQPPSLPGADPRSGRPRCDGRESKFLADLPVGDCERQGGNLS